MEYRRLGSSGVKVSELSFGSWVTFGSQIRLDEATELMSYAFDHGVNFFDNAEVYAAGQSEQIMGQALKKLGWRRSSYLISTKLYWGINDGPNEKNTLNRKYLLEGIDGSLKRLQLDHVDLLFCHRPDPNTPLIETVRTMHEIVQSGRALYWGTSEWSAAEIYAAWQIANQFGWHPPQMEQPQYNLTHRQRVEKEYARLYSDCGLGLTTWSPLASGLLTGKYNDGQIPKGSRVTLPGYEWLQDRVSDTHRQHQAKLLTDIANRMDVKPLELAIGWCLNNVNVSTVILGASSINQLKENLGSLRLKERFNQSLLEELETIFPI